MDTGIPGAAITALLIVAFGLAGWLLQRIRDRRHERLFRLEARRVWRQDWLVDPNDPISLAEARSRQRDRLKVVA